MNAHESYVASPISATLADSMAGSSHRSVSGGTPTSSEMGRTNYSTESATDPNRDQASQRSAVVSQLEKLVQTVTRQQLQADSTNIFEDVLQHVEGAIIATVLESTDNNITQAARRLGISRPTLRSKLRSRMPFK